MASPHQMLLTFPRNGTWGCPILSSAVCCEGWETANVGCHRCRSLVTPYDGHPAASTPVNCFHASARGSYVAVGNAVGRHRTNCMKAFRRLAAVAAIAMAVLPLLVSRVAVAQAAAVPATTPNPTAFEAASIKPSETMNGRDMDIGDHRLDYDGVTLLDCIRSAYNLRADQISAPAWMNDARYEIHAVGPAGSFGNGGWRPMLQSLLADRFRLKVHQETRSLPVYELKVAKKGPKFKQVAKTGRSGVMGHNTHYTFTAVTMAQLAETLSTIADRLVVDKTGLSGQYDFELQYSREAAFGVSGRSSGDSNQDPDIFTAVREQLGLKLAAGNGPLPFLVVDQADKTPTPN